MEQLNDKFYEDLLLTSANAKSLKASKTKHVEITEMKPYYEQYFHHYLPKDVPQQKMKFYQVDAVTSQIQDEQIFVAEHEEKI